MSTLSDWPAQLAALPVSAALRSSEWAYPLVEIVHLLGMAALFGSIVVVDLRLAGLGRQLPVTTLLRHALPVSVCGFAAIAASGVLLFLAHAEDLASNPAFLAKLVLVAIGLANAAWFHAAPFRKLLAANPGWNRDGPPPPGVRASAIASLVTWTLVICAGRLIAYL